MATYVYDKLNPSRKEIRICTIHPGAFDDPIECSLRTVSLDDSLEYGTLSYAWGAPVFDHTLLIDGAVLKVTKNLHNAIRYLRRQQRPFCEDGHDASSDNASRDDETTSSHPTEASGALWADAICINQADVYERSSQVSLMGDIYRCGGRLHVWIGTVEEIRDAQAHKHPREPPHDFDLATPEKLARFKDSLLAKGITLSSPPPLASASLRGADVDVAGAMEILKLFAHDRHVYQLPFFRSTAVDTDLEKEEFWYKCLAMLLGILTQPWWKRVWVIQEVVLSSSTLQGDTLLHIGHYTTPLSACESLRAYFFKHIFGCCHQWDKFVGGRYGLLYRLRDAAGSLDGLRIALKSYKDGTFRLTAAYAIVPLREAADPRDYIYGVRALMEDSSSSHFEVDYRKSVAELYIVATRALFNAGSSLEYLERAGGLDSENRHRLPSWCLDWSEHKKSISTYYGPGLFNAARGCPHQSYHCEESNTLSINAAAYCRITSVSSVIDLSVLDPVDSVLKWMEGVGFRELEAKIDTILKVLMRDYYVDRDLGFRRISPEYMKILREWRVFMASNKRPPNETSVEVGLRDVDARIRRPQRLLLMSYGVLGAGPTAAREGDCVFVAKGSVCPLILRPVHQSARGNAQQDLTSYQFVGRCYVDGIMDGEAVDTDTEWQKIRLF
ncbi:MAG: hypothetical protein Q9221_003596 [Calogaya cf. arnoldii]